MKILDIAICTHERSSDLNRTLSSLAALETPVGVELRVVLVLNACSYDTIAAGRAAAAQLPFPAHVFEEPVPGLSQARNRAIAESCADWIAFLDDDVRVSPGWARALVATARDYRADIVAGRTLLWWRDCARPDWWSRHFNWIVSAFDHGESDAILKPASAVGANFAVSLAVWNAVGKFDTSLGRNGASMTAGEESDYLARAEAQGFICAYSASAMVEHLVAPKRLDEAYFREVANQQGRAHYHVHPRRGLARLRSAAYQIAIIGHVTLLEARARKNSTAARYALVKKAGALGALTTLFSSTKSSDKN